MTPRQITRDPRTRRTLALLSEAMTELLRTRSLNEINVSELCRRAGVHRTTFYKHFSSVAEYATFMFSSLLDDLTAVSEDNLPADPGDVPAAHRQALTELLEHVMADRALYRRLFAPDGDFLFQRIVADLMSARVLAAHRTLLPSGRELGMDEATAARMVGAACAAALAVWAEQEETDAAGRAAEIMAALPPWWNER